MSFFKRVSERGWWGRVGVLLYLLIGFAGGALSYLALEDQTRLDENDLLLGLGASLISVAIVFFLVDLLFNWNLLHDERKQLRDQLETMQEVLSRAEAKIVGVRVSSGAKDIYEAAISLLQSDEPAQWERITLFAPVGVWRNEEHKKAWLNALKEAATERDGQIKVKHVEGIFGLPPVIKDDGSKIDKTETEKNLRQFRDTLVIFAGMENVKLHYMPSFPVSIGMGALVFEPPSGQPGFTTFALASHGSAETVDVAINLLDQKGFSDIKRWLGERLFMEQTGKYVLQSKDITFEEGWQKAISEYNREYDGKELPVEYVEGEKQLNAAVKALTPESEDQLRVLMVGAMRSPIDWTKYAAEHLKKRNTKKAKLPGSLVAVVVLPLNKLDSEEKKALMKDADDRFEIYQNAKVQKRVRLYLVDANLTVGADILLIDKKHLIIGVPPFSINGTLVRGVIFRNQTEVAGAYAEWFDQEVLTLAGIVEYSEWKRKNNSTDNSSTETPNKDVHGGNDL